MMMVNAQTVTHPIEVRERERTRSADLVMAIVNSTLQLCQRTCQARTQRSSLAPLHSRSRQSREMCLRIQQRQRRRRRVVSVCVVCVCASPTHTPDCVSFSVSVRQTWHLLKSSCIHGQWQRQANGGIALIPRTFR